jgi:hypothetical protein
MTSTEIKTILENRHESLDQEIKSWLGLSKEDGQFTLMKAVCALTNHGGGRIIIGFDDKPPHNPQTIPVNIDKSNYNQDFINGIISRHLEPACHVNVYSDKIDDSEYFVIEVPTNFPTPVRINSKGADDVWEKDTYFIRKEGPKSERPLNGREWDNFLNNKMLLQKNKLLVAIERLINGDEVKTSTANDSLNNWTKECLKTWTEKTKATNNNYGCYWTAIKLPNFSFDTLSDIKSTISQVKGYTGWPPFTIIEDFVSPSDNKIESWIGNYREEYWTITQDGNFFMARSFQEDTERNEATDRIFSNNLPIWRVGEALLFAKGIASIADIKVIKIKFGWEGLKDRKLSSWGSAGVIDFYSTHKHITKVDKYETKFLDINIDDLEVNIRKIVHKILAPLYELFDFEELHQLAIDSHINKLLGIRD